MNEFDEIQIEVINKSLCRLNDVAITEYLKFCNNKLGYSPGPFREVDKYKLILYQQLEGLSNNSIGFISNSTFRAIYHKFWVRRAEEVEKWTDWWLSNFSTPELRLIYAKIYNPQMFKTVTMVIDGKISRKYSAGQVTSTEKRSVERAI